MSFMYPVDHPIGQHLVITTQFFNFATSRDLLQICIAIAMTIQHSSVT